MIDIRIKWSVGVKSAFRTYGFCLFFLLFACLRAASGQDSPIVRGPFGKPVGLYDEGGNLTSPITVYEDSQVEILIPDITSEGWSQWHVDQYRAEGKYWVTLYSFFKGKARCLGTAGSLAQSGCVAYARYEQQMVSVDTKLHTMEFFGVTAYAGERMEPVGVHPAPSGSHAITSLDPGLAKAINKISAIVTYQLDSYTGLSIREAGAQQAAIVARMITNSTHPNPPSSSIVPDSAIGNASGEFYPLAARKAAEQGDANAQFNLGNAYYFGRGVPQDFAQAVLWYRKAAEQGVQNAELNLGNAYRTGQGVPQDYATAVVWYRKAAEKGDAEAQNNLGVSYYYGKGVVTDYAQADEWYRKAAEEGNTDAQFSLGASYALGKGVPQDYAQAAVWYRKAAEQGNAYAQFNLGIYYDHGQGVPQDYAEAYFWLDVAASAKLEGLNEEDIAKLKDAAASHLTGAILLQTQKRAQKWFETHIPRSPLVPVVHR